MHGSHLRVRRGCADGGAVVRQVVLRLGNVRGSCRRAWLLVARRGLADDDGGRRRDPGDGGQRRRGGGAAPDDGTDADVDDGEEQQRDDVDGRREPGDVQRQRPLRLEVLPTVVDAGSDRRQLDEVEDDQLWDGEDPGGEPGDGDEAVGAGGRPRVTAHRVTDGDIPIQGGGHEHIRRTVQHQDL